MGQQDQNGVPTPVDGVSLPRKIESLKRKLKAAMRKGDSEKIISLTTQLAKAEYDWERSLRDAHREARGGKMLPLVRWDHIFRNTAESFEEVEVLWLDNVPGPGEWCLCCDTELFEDGFTSEKDARVRLKEVEKDVESLRKAQGSKHAIMIGGNPEPVQVTIYVDVRGDLVIADLPCPVTYEMYNDTLVLTKFKEGTEQ